MFERVSFLSQPPRSIALQTRRGRDIDNVQELPPRNDQLNQGQLLVKKFGTFWQERRPPVGIYNCAGLIWASRRTSVLEQTAWDAIIADDDLREIAARDVHPGDLALYVAGNEYLHLSLVLDVRNTGGLRTPWCLSKFSSVSGEFFHSVYDVPYERQGIPFRVTFLSDRQST